MTTGLVSLVGAGPGHPDHLTVRAARRLREADLVLHDALVSADVLALATRAQRIDVGKRGGGRSARQDDIHRLLIEHARRGQRVVRLKGGDPFVFGRGAEEAQALIDAGISFEVVPGVTAAVAAPGLAGIPVTHRGCARGFVVTTGSPIDHLEETLPALADRGLTLVLLMAMHVRAEIAAVLVRSGWSPRTPCALVVGASGHGWTWRGRLAELDAVVIPPAHADRPGTIVVGDVAALPISLSDGEWSAAAVEQVRRSSAFAALSEGGLHVCAR